MMSAREAVTIGYQAMEIAFHAGDADTIAGLYTDDAEMFVPGLPVIEGRTAIRETWRMIVGSGGNSVTVDVREVDESGDLAYDTGSFKATAPNGSILNTGKWMVIWKRQSSGAWKIQRDLMHWDIPPGME